MENRELEIICCFCGESLSFDKSIEITIECDKGTKEIQAVYAHSKCLNKVLHKSILRGFNLE